MRAAKPSVERAGTSARPAREPDTETALQHFTVPSQLPFEPVCSVSSYSSREPSRVGMATRRVIADATRRAARADHPQVVAKGRVAGIVLLIAPTGAREDLSLARRLPG
jgi:hypothetical protein